MLHSPPGTDCFRVRASGHLEPCHSQSLTLTHTSILFLSLLIDNADDNTTVESVWTIDLVYILRKLSNDQASLPTIQFSKRSPSQYHVPNLSPGRGEGWDFTYYTSTIGVDAAHSKEKFYRKVSLILVIFFSSRQMIPWPTYFPSKVLLFCFVHRKRSFF